MHRLIADLSLAALALSFLVSGAPHAEVIHVPAGQPTLGAALRVASPTATIVLASGTWGPVTIDRPITIVGVGNPRIVGGGTTGSFQAPIRLAGKGFGDVRLGGLTVGGTIDGTLFTTARAGIEGLGFTSLQVSDCTIDGPAWSFVTGIAHGQAAIDVDLPLVLVERSIVRASASLANGPITVGVPGAPGIRTSESLVLLDTIVRGGGAGPYTHTAPACAGECPPSRGGDGVQCTDLFVSGGQRLAGFGALWEDQSGAPCCIAPDGFAERANRRTVLGGQLQGTGAATLGGAFSLSWNFPDFGAQLWYSDRLLPPVLSGGTFTFLDQTRLLYLGMVQPGGNLVFLVPAGAVSVLGLPFAFQLRFASGAVSRPVTGIVFD